MKNHPSNRWLPFLAFSLVSSLVPHPRAYAAPTILSGTTDKTPPNGSIFKLSVGDSFAAVMELDLGQAQGEVEVRPGISGDGKRYTGIGGSLEVTIGGVSWGFQPLFLVIGDDFVDDAGKVAEQPVDLWHLHAIGPQGLLLTIGLWQRDGSAISTADLFMPEATNRFSSATWALFAPSFDRNTGQQLPRLDNVASGVIEAWAVQSAGSGGSAR